LPETVAITASDLNQPMLEVGASRGTSRPVHWRQADAMDLPFDDDSFDAVMCQFGAMFLPERPRAFAEAHRVLRHGGRFVFSVWDRIENNEFARVVADAVGTVFPDDPPTFLTRVPYAYHDAALIRVDLAAGGFATSTSVEPLEIRSRAASCSIPAVGFCQGSAWASTGRAGHALRREHPQAKWSIRTLADTTRRRGPSLRDRGSALRGGAPGRHRRPEPGNRIDIVYDPAEPSHARPVRGRPNLIRHGPLLSDSPDARRFSFRQKCVSGSAVETHP